MYDIIIWVIFGGVAGWIASMIMKTDAQMGVVANIVIGIVGAFIGGFVVRMLTGSEMNTFSISSLLVAILGSVILLALVKTFTRMRASHKV